MAPCDFKCVERARPLLQAFALGLLLGGGKLAAQASADAGERRWRFAIGFGASSFSGASRESVASGEQLAFAPYRAAMWGLEAEYGGESLRFGLSARYGQPGIRVRGVPPAGEEGTGSPIVVLIENAFHLASFGAAVSTRLHRLASGPSLRGALGVGLERWASPEVPIRTLLGGSLGFSAEVAIGGGFVAGLKAELGMTPGSPFRPSDLPEGYEPRATWRRSLSAAVGWTF